MFYLVIVATNKQTDKQTDRQTDRQTYAGDYIIPRESFRGVINDTIIFFLNCSQLFVMSNHNSLRVLFDTVVSVHFI